MKYGVNRVTLVGGIIIVKRESYIRIVKDNSFTNGILLKGHIVHSE